MLGRAILCFRKNAEQVSGEYVSGKELLQFCKGVEGLLQMMFFEGG